MSEGPWKAEDVIDLVDPLGPWHGEAQPPPLMRHVPGGLVFRLIDPDGQMVEEVDVTDQSIEQVSDIAERHAEACCHDPRGRVHVFDGDTGEPILVLGTTPLP